MSRYAHNGIVYKDFDHPKYRYKLLKSYSVINSTALAPDTQHDSDYLSTSGYLLHIKPSYAWDGPSGPTIDTKNFMRASLVHDALYQLIREGALPYSARKAADDLLYRICVEDGMNRFRAWYVWVSVRTFGGAHAQPGA